MYVAWSLAFFMMIIITQTFIEMFLKTTKKETNTLRVIIHKDSNRLAVRLMVREANQKWLNRKID